jgi:hypothetical protein
VQGSEWLVAQVALLHTWVGEDQCRATPYKGTTSPIPLEPLLLLLLSEDYKNVPLFAFGITLLSVKEGNCWANQFLATQFYEH